MGKANRRTAVVTGIFFIAAAVAAVAALPLYGAVLGHPEFVLSGSAGEAAIKLGALCEFVVAVSVIGTAVTLFPVVRRQNESIALAYVAGRIVEAMAIVIGVMSLLTVVTLRHQLTAADGQSFVVAARALIALHDWTFLVGPGLTIGVNTTLLAYLMHASRLVPRWIPILGLVGGPLVFASSIAVMFGAYSQLSAPAGLAAIPVTAWEMSLAVWMIAKGFRPAAFGYAGAASDAKESKGALAPS